MKLKIISIAFLLTFLCISCNETENQTKKTANKIISVIENKNFNELAEFIDKDLGLYVSQKITASFNYFNHISFDDIINATESNKEMSFYIDDDPSERWNTTVFKFLSATFPVSENRKRHVSYNAYISSIDWALGAQSIAEIFPDSIFIEYYYEPSGLYGDLDWQSIYLIFKKEKNNIFLIGLACNYGGI